MARQETAPDTIILYHPSDAQRKCEETEVCHILVTDPMDFSCSDSN